ncbi:SurA N-terminal domain-containing protein [Halocynthiibacter styelae]|uniref:SurA N-terminal domain-containing protein n=1 Tax=Halocynthiibacter styelae TaxID=2761955 RepID=A0A8J7INB9_9RHOB|nr:SurA N-terminal domain-containing protein [Paenihalocynthiibacter styelae]MBI1492051.1 SurA N-terminal domain-containing protein [Paenihalocynthiibacter styelae]
MASAKSGPITKFFVWAIIVMLVVGLGGFGLSNFGGSSQAVVTAGSRSVTVQEYYNALQGELRQVAAETQQPATLASVNEIYTQIYGQTLDQQVLDRLTLDAALDNEAAEMGISAGDVQVRDQLISTPAFAGLDGSFDEDAYKETLSRNNLNTRDYENSIRDDIARTLVQAAMVSGLNAGEAQVNALLNYEAQRRDISWIRLDEGDLPDPLATPTEEQLAAYHEANAAADFTTPRTKEITFVQLLPEMLFDTVEIDETALQELYDSRADEFIVAERRLLERLVFGSQEDADTAATRLTSGEITFDALVEERGLNLSDLDMGDVLATDLDAETAEAIFALDGPGVTGTLPSTFGPAIFRMNGILPERITTFETALPILRQDLAADRARRVIEALATDIDDLLAGGATLEDVAEETDMVLNTISWSDDQGAGIAAYVDFREAAAALTEDDFPEVMTLDDGGIFAMRLDGFTEPFVLPIDEVREKVIAGWETQETDTVLAAHAETLAGQIALGATAEDLGLESMSESDLTRRSFIDAVPSDMVRSVFGTGAGTHIVLSEFGSTFLVFVNDVKDPDMENPETIALQERIQTALTQSIAQDAYAAWARERLNAAGATRNQAAINGLLTQIP